MSMSKDKRVALTLGVLALVLFGPILIWPISNAGAVALSLLLEREPSNPELTGGYMYTAGWGSASLAINPNGTFREIVRDKSGSTRTYEGRWSSHEDDNSAKIDFQPFGMVWDDDHHREITYFAMNFYKRRLGKTYATINSDLGEQFEHQ